MVSGFYLEKFRLKKQKHNSHLNKNFVQKIIYIGSVPLPLNTYTCF